MSTALWVIVGVIVLAVLWLVGVYNGLIRLRNRVDEAWSDIDVQLKRRYDLIPNLVEMVKGYAKHEEGVFTKVTEARANAMKPQGQKAQAKSENMLEGALKSIFALSENYPELKANDNFAKLQDELTDTERKLIDRHDAGLLGTEILAAEILHDRGVFDFQHDDWTVICSRHQRLSNSTTRTPLKVWYSTMAIRTTLRASNTGCCTNLSVSSKVSAPS